MLRTMSRPAGADTIAGGPGPILEGDTVRGVIFESKEGRKAVLAKVVIDATGDGDIFAQTGTPYSSLADGGTRSSTTALVWRIGGINWDQFEQWKRTRPQAAAALRERLSAVAGFRCLPLPTNQNDMCWVNNWHPAMDCTGSPTRPRRRWIPAPPCVRCWPI